MPHLTIGLVEGGKRIASLSCQCCRLFSDRSNDSYKLSVPTKSQEDFRVWIDHRKF